MSGSLNAGDSTIINVKFKSSSLIAGTYTNSIIINYNATPTSSSTVLCSLVVAGAPVISLNKTCINFGSINQSITKSDSVLISNNGCSNLTMNLRTTNSVFTSSITSYTIPAYSSKMVGVSLLSQTTNTFTDTLYISNNARDTAICLTATITPASIISHTPNPVIGTVTVCNDVITVPVKIINTGNATLTYSSVRGPGTNNVLVYTYGVYTSNTEYTNLINGINAYYTNYTLTTTATTTSAQLQADLVGKSVFIIPKITSNSITHWSSFSTVLQNFVASGGTIIMTGNSSSYNYAANAGLLTIGTFSSNIYGGNLTATNTSHPLYENVTFPVSTNYYSYPKTITNSDYTSLAKLSGYEAIGYRSVGIGKIIFLAFDYVYTNTNQDRIISNAVKWAINSSTPVWLNMTPSTGTVAINDTLNTTISFNSSGLINGTYSGNYLLSTNAPLNPTYKIPCTFTVTANPIIGLNTTCLNYGNLFKGVSKKDSIKISNTGCSDLLVNLSSNNVAFTPALASYTISPGQLKWVVVTLNSSVVGALSDTLTIRNNNKDTSICLTATIVPPPVISHFPNPIIGSVTTCGDSITIPVKIINSGGTILNYTSISGTSGANVLAYTYGVYTSNTEYTNLINGINTYFTGYTLTTTSTTSALQLQADLVGKSVFIIPKISTNSISHWSSFSTVLQNFVLNGGTIIMTGNASSYNYATSAGLLTISSFAGTYSSGNISVSSASDPIFNNVVLPISTTYYSYPKIISNNDYTSLATLSGYEAIGYRTVGAGKILFVAFDYSYTNSNLDRIISNAVKNAITSSQSSIANLSPKSSSVAINDTLSATITLRSKDLVNGTYNGNYIISTNDPLHATYSIPYKLIVAGQSVISANKNCIHFPNTPQGVVAKDSIKISNSGCANLIISAISFSNTAYYSDSSTLTILPGKYKWISVYSSSSTVGSLTGDMTLTNNASLLTVCLTTTISPASDINVTPNPITAVVNNCVNPATVSFTIENKGQSNLDYSINLNIVNKNVLAYVGGVNTSTGGVYQNTIVAINSYYTDYTLSTTTTTSAATLKTLLADKKILLFPSVSSLPLNYSLFSTVINDFVNNGGIVIYCGSSYINPISEIGLLNANTTSSIYSTTIYNNDLSHPIMNGVTSSFYSTYYGYDINVSNVGWKRLANSSGSNSTVGELSKGLGKIIYVGFDYYYTTTDQSKIIANAIKYGINYETSPSWLTSGTPLTGTVVSNSNQIINLTINTSLLSSGLNTGYLKITSNDPDESLIKVPLNITKDNILKCVDFSSSFSSCIGNGNVSFVASGWSNNCTYSWNFGDSTFSTLANPVHHFNRIGTYAVSLTACLNGTCNSVTKYVTISQITTPAPSICEPQTTSFCCGVGIKNVTFNTLNNQSSDASEGYKDFTCNTATLLMADTSYHLTVKTGSIENENVVAWIDFDNDGVFATQEKVFESLDTYIAHTGSVTIPKIGFVENVPLRMRIKSEKASVNISNACTNLTYGQAEDYTVKIKKKAVSTVGIGEIVVDNTIELIPNPTNNYFYAKGLEINNQYTFILYDIQGKVILNDELKLHTPISVNELEQGAYFVKIYSNSKEVKNQKLMIVR